MKRALIVFGIAGLIALAFFILPLYVGVGAWPELYDINIGQGMLQIWPADILIDMKIALAVVLVGGFLGWEIIKNFRDGFNGK